MSSQRGDRILRWIERILRLAPLRFRERRGEECLRVYRERLRDAPAGWRGARFRLRELVGAAGLVARLRLGEDPFGAGLGHLQVSLRTFRRHPGYAWIVVGVLALGVGTTTAVFSAANAYLFRPLSFADADRLFTIYETNPQIGWTVEDAVSAAPANVLDWRERIDAFEDVAMYSDFVDRIVFPGEGDPRLLTYAQVSGNFFDVLGVRPALGPGFDRDDTWAGEDGFGIVISHALWQRMFGGDPEVIGRTLDFGVERAEVVGVMPQAFRFPSDEVDLWRTPGWERAARDAVWFRRAHFVRPIVRLAPGVTRPRAAEELDVVVTRLQEEYPGTNAAMGARITPFRDFLTRDVQGPLQLLLGAAGLLLLLAAVNVATLSLVRAGDRAREVAVRRALGAGGRTVAVLVLAETLVLALVGGVVGLALAWAGGRALSGSTPIGIDGATTLALDHRVLLVALGASLLCWIVAGGTAVGRAFGAGFSRGLRTGGLRSSSGPERRRGARALVATEVALAVVLLVGAGLMVRTARSLYAVDPGFDTDGVVAAEITVPVQRYADAPEVIALQDRLVRTLEARPGVQAAGIVGGLPLAGPGWSSQFKAEDWPADRVGWNVVHRRADRGYFEALDIPLVRGRHLSAGADSTVPLEVVVNQAFAREHFPDEDPIGVRIAYDEAPTESSYWYEIVGVVGDQHQVSPGVPPRAEIFEHRRQDWGRSVWVVLRMDGPADDGFATLRSGLEEVDPLLLPERVRSLSEIRRASMERERTILSLLLGFGVAALLLAAVGVYGVTAQLVRRRRREIGIRIALGAARRKVRGMVVVQGVSGAAVGLVLGLTAAVFLTGVMESVLFGVRPTDPWTMTAVTLLLGAVVLAACWVPARRATRTDPVETLKAE